MGCERTRGIKYEGSFLGEEIRGEGGLGEERNLVWFC